MRMSSHPLDQQVKQWAERQLADYDARQPGSLFAEGLTLDVEVGYELQAAVAELRRARGEHIIGYKVGCTSDRIRGQLGIDHCVTGRLYATEQHQSGASLARSDFASLAVEGELAALLARTPRDDDFVADSIPACVERVFPVVELHHLVMRGARPSAGELVAHNALHAGFVRGSGIPADKCRQEITLAIYRDNELIEECAGNSLMKTIRSSLLWLSQTTAERGDPLAPGQIVLTGSVPGLLPMDHAGKIEVRCGILGDVRVNFF